MTMQATLDILKCEYNLCVQAYHNMLIRVTLIVVGSWTCDNSLQQILFSMFRLLSVANYRHKSKIQLLSIFEHGNMTLKDYIM